MSYSLRHYHTSFSLHEKTKQAGSLSLKNRCSSTLDLFTFLDFLMDFLLDFLTDYEYYSFRDSVQFRLLSQHGPTREFWLSLRADLGLVVYIYSNHRDLYWQSHVLWENLRAVEIQVGVGKSTRRIEQFPWLVCSTEDLSLEVHVWPYMSTSYTALRTSMNNDRDVHVGRTHLSAVIYYIVFHPPVRD